MGYYEGLLGGFSARKREREEENLAESRRAAEQEAKIFETLLSSEDPEIQALATTGLLESARPRRRKGGLRGWLGELEGSETFASMQNLINRPVPVTERRMTSEGAVGLPSKQITPKAGVPAPSLEEAPMGTPAQSMTEPGAPAAKPLEYTYTPGPMVGRPPTFETQTTMQRRRVFPTAEDKIRRETLARERAEVEGRVAGRVAAGMPREEALEIERRTMRGAGFGVREGNVHQLPTGEWVQDLYDTTGKITQQIPAAAPGTLSSRPATSKEIIAFRKYGAPGEDPLSVMRRITPQQMGTVLEEERVDAGLRAAQVALARANAMADAPLATKARFDATELLNTKWQKVQSPLREMERQHQLMQVSARRFKEGDKIGGSQGVLVTFQKILDPPSVVRESEYERTPEGLSLYQKLQGMKQRLIEGGAGVPQEELDQMVETARQYLVGMQGWNAVEHARMEQQAREYGIDPSGVFGPSPMLTQPPPGSTPASPTQAPAAPARTANAPVTVGGSAIFVGTDGKLHSGSTTGPLLPGQ